jgi:hypothetical protein
MKDRVVLQIPRTNVSIMPLLIAVVGDQVTTFKTSATHLLTTMMTSDVRYSSSPSVKKRSFLASFTSAASIVASSSVQCSGVQNQIQKSCLPNMD